MEEKEYQVWLEGYLITGGSSDARFLGQHKARTFNEACQIALKENDWSMSLYNEQHNSYYGCRFFDNEQDARSAFG